MQTISENLLGEDIQALAKGIRERSSDFRFNDFANLEYAFPPVQEQNSIVEFIETSSKKF